VSLLTISSSYAGGSSPGWLAVADPYTSCLEGAFRFVMTGSMRTNPTCL
jgi:hypothetical protein